MEYGDREQTISEYMTIKKHIKACFNMEKFVDIMKECIDAAENFDFSSVRARKFIDTKKPIFILKTDILDGVDTNTVGDNELNDLLNQVSRALTDQVINPISKRMMETLMDPKKYNELVEVNRDLVNLCITNIYKVRIDKRRGMVQLEYFDF